MRLGKMGLMPVLCHYQPAAFCLLPSARCPPPPARRLLPAASCPSPPARPPPARPPPARPPPAPPPSCPPTSCPACLLPPAPPASCLPASCPARLLPARLLPTRLLPHLPPAPPASCPCPASCPRLLPLTPLLPPASILGVEPRSRGHKADTLPLSYPHIPPPALMFNSRGLWERIVDYFFELVPRTAISLIYLNLDSRPFSKRLDRWMSLKNLFLHPRAVARWIEGNSSSCVLREKELLNFLKLSDYFLKVWTFFSKLQSI